MESTLIVERSVVIAAAQERVWQAITQPEQIAQWFEPVTFDRLEVGQPVHFRWEPNDSVDFNETSGEIAVVEPMDRFAFRWRIALPDPTLTLVVFDLETVPEGTRVTVTETGFEALPASVREKRFHDNVGGWTEMIAHLAAYLNSDK